MCSTTIHDRFQEWRASGVFERLMRELVRFYARRKGIEWTWQAIDSKACPAPLGGQATGKSPVDRSKRGSKIHILVDGRGAPLAVQHLCLDKGYDFADVHQFVQQERYVAHIKHRRRRNEPVIEDCPIPGETTIVEREGTKRFPPRLNQVQPGHIGGLKPKTGCPGHDERRDYRRCVERH